MSSDDARPCGTSMGGVTERGNHVDACHACVTGRSMRDIGLGTRPGQRANAMRASQSYPLSGPSLAVNAALQMAGSCTSQVIRQ